MQDGEHYCVLTRTGIEKYSYKTGEKVDVVCAFSDPMRKKVKPLPPIESYEFSPDEQKILLSAQFEPIYRHSGVSTYFLYTIADGSMVCLTNEGKQRLTTFSPDGKMVAFVRDNNLYVMALNSLKETAVTTDGKFNEIINGTTDWVYEEEFGITQGFYWSPDSKKIAFYRFDESRVKQYTMQMWGELYPENYTYKYPKAGEDNSVVDVLIYDIESEKTLKLNIGSQNDQYMPRIQWTQDPNTLALMRMNRLQDKMELLLADATTGAIRNLYTEEDEAYVEVPETWMFLKDGKHMLLTSEKDGYNHIYMYDLNGRLVNQITQGYYDVVSVCSVDEKAGVIYYLSHESSPINKELYSIDFHTANGKLLKTLQDNADLCQRMAEYGVGHKTFGTLTTEFGTDLNYYIILPPDFDSTKKYPLFFYVYGGPGNQQVTNSYGYSDYYWFHMLAQQGYVVACFDGRGTGGRGAHFKKMTYKNLGRMECEDAVAAARWFGKKQWIDETLRRLPVHTLHPQRSRRVQICHRRRTRHHVALLRQHLHRAIPPAPAGQRPRLRRQLPPQLRQSA